MISKMQALENQNLNFALVLNLKINPENSKEASGDYKAVAKYISSMKDLWLAPLIKLEQADLLKNFKLIYQKEEKGIALDQLHDFIIEETKINLSKLIKNYPEHLKEGIPTAMTIFGGFTNATAIHLALAKIAIEKLMEKNELKNIKNALTQLKHCSAQFAKLQANTLKLIENMNSVISNQDSAYNFDSNNFYLDEKLRLLPTEEFINLVIEKANDPQTNVESYDYKDDHSTPYIVTKKFSDTYTKPRGCPIQASKSDNNSVLDEFLDRITAILTNITDPQ